MPAGERRADGSFPEGTFNFLVDKRLKEMAKKLKADEKGEKDKEEKKKEEKNNDVPKKRAGKTVAEQEEAYPAASEVVVQRRLLQRDTRAGSTT